MASEESHDASSRGPTPSGLTAPAVSGDRAQQDMNAAILSQLQTIQREQVEQRAVMTRLGERLEQTALTQTAITGQQATSSPQPTATEGQGSADNASGRAEPRRWPDRWPQDWTEPLQWPCPISEDKSRWENTAIPLPPTSAPGLRDEQGSLLLDPPQDGKEYNWEDSDDNRAYGAWIQTIWEHVQLPWEENEESLVHEMGMDESYDIMLEGLNSLSDVTDVNNLGNLNDMQITIDPDAYSTWPSQTAHLFTGDFAVVATLCRSQNVTWLMVVEAVLTILARAGELKAAARNFQYICARGPEPEESRSAYFARMLTAWGAMSTSERESDITAQMIGNSYHWHDRKLERYLRRHGKLHPLVKSLEETARYFGNANSAYYNIHDPVPADEDEDEQ